jgi:hypothetical protein
VLSFTLELNMSLFSVFFFCYTQPDPLAKHCFTIGFFGDFTIPKMWPLSDG